MIKLFNLLFAYIVASLTMCFQFFDDPPAKTDDPPGTKDADPPVKDPNELTREDLQGIIKEVVKTSTKEQIDELKEDMLKVNRQSIFPHVDGDFGSGEAEAGHIAGKGSIIDTTFFSKGYNPGRIKSYGNNPWMADGIALGQQLVSIGGPFKRLSPEMETFGKMIKYGRGTVARSKDAGIDVAKHNEIVLEHHKQAGMSEGVLADGGALVPVEFIATVIEFATQQSTILSKVWRMPMNTNVMRIPRLVQAAGSYFGGIQLFSPDEGEQKQDTKPTLERLTFEAKKLIGLIYLTDELIADSIINIINYITGLFTRAFQYELERRAIRATGGAAAGPCMGIINDPAINVVARQTANTISYNDVINLDNALDENFTDLSWITRKATQNTLMGLVDNNNRPIFLADYGVFTGQPLHPPTMITYPVHRTRNVPTMGTQGDVILGDLSWYLLTIRQDLTIDSSAHVRFIYDEQTLRFVMRLDGMPAISTAFAILGDVAS